FINKPANPTKANAIKYSIKACKGVNIHASPKTICKIPQIKPDAKEALTPHLKAMIKIGTIAKEIEIEGRGFIEGIKSSNIANAPQISITISVCKLNVFFIKKSSLVCNTQVGE